MIDYKEGCISRENFNQIKWAQEILSEVVYPYPYGGITVDGKDYVDFDVLCTKEEIRKAIAIMQEVIPFCPDVK